MKRAIIFSVFGIFLLLYSLSGVLASVDVGVVPISDSYIIELNKPAEFDLAIKNTGMADTFTIYSLVGVDILPDTTYQLSAGESRTIRIQVIPQEGLRSKKGFVTFEYLIKDSEGNIQRQKLSVNIVNLADAVDIAPENINPDSQTIKINFKNTLMYDFSDLKIKMNSAFFDYESDVPLKSLETKSIEVNIDREKLKRLSAGPYLIETQVISSGKVGTKDILVRFLEQENIKTTETKEGILINRYEVTKTNVGNVKKTVVVDIKKSLISYLFTSTNIPVTKSENTGFSRHYIWEEDLAPGDEIKVVMRTNWLFPILVIILIIILVWLIKNYIEKDIVFRKRVSYVNTRGGEFALKVNLKIKAKRFVERIKIVDKIPALVSLYDKFGAVAPDKIDVINKRLEWNVESLNKGEERVFSYIIYSKIGVVGRFELPSARAIYEKEGEIKDINSNRSFFVNEPRKSSP